MRRICCPVILALGLAACGGGDTESAVDTPGADESPKTRVLEAGAAVLQDKPPIDAINAYLDGFHFYNGRMEAQMEAHHYCSHLNEDVIQCVIYDGNVGDAKLMGVEYIVSERLFAALPESEKPLWHSHSYEVKSGTLVAPGIPEIAEDELMEKLVGTYGKTWHTWHTRHGVQPGDAMPLGPAVLAWSFSRDGELDPALVTARDARLGIDTARIRQDRQSLRDAARPQSGVDALRAHFPEATPIPGVLDAAAPEARHSAERLRE